MQGGGKAAAMASTIDSIDFPISPRGLEETEAAMRAAARAAGAGQELQTVKYWQKALDGLLYVSMWLAESRKEKEREAVHRLRGLLLAGSLDAGAVDLEPHPLRAGAVCVPAYLPEMGDLWERVVHRTDALRTVLQGRQVLMAVAGRLTRTRGRGREIAWCVAAMVHMRSMEEDPHI